MRQLVDPHPLLEGVGAHAFGDDPPLVALIQGEGLGEPEVLVVPVKGHALVTAPPAHVSVEPGLNPLDGGPVGASVQAELLHEDRGPHVRRGVLLELFVRHPLHVVVARLVGDGRHFLDALHQLGPLARWQHGPQAHVAVEQLHQLLFAFDPLRPQLEGVHPHLVEPGSSFGQRGVVAGGLLVEEAHGAGVLGVSQGAPGLLLTAAAGGVGRRGAGFGGRRHGDGLGGWGSGDGLGSWGSGDGRGGWSGGDRRARGRRGARLGCGCTRDAGLWLGGSGRRRLGRGWSGGLGCRSGGAPAPGPGARRCVGCRASEQGPTQQQREQCSSHGDPSR